MSSYITRVLSLNKVKQVIVRAHVSVSSRLRGLRARAQREPVAY